MKTYLMNLKSSHPGGQGIAARRVPWLAGMCLLAAAALLILPATAPAFGRQGAQKASQTGSIPDVKCVIGCENMKSSAKGTLSIVPSGLEFATDKEKADIPAASITDIFTGNESRQDVTGAGKIITMGIPYGGGRLVSLFSHKVEVLTVEYVDSNGGFHGAIFVLPAGKATSIKDQLVAQGAKVSAHVEPPAPKEQKP